MSSRPFYLYPAFVLQEKKKRGKKGYCWEYFFHISFFFLGVLYMSTLADYLSISLFAYSFIYPFVCLFVFVRFVYNYFIYLPFSLSLSVLPDAGQLVRVFFFFFFFLVDMLI